MTLLEKYQNNKQTVAYLFLFAACIASCGLVIAGYFYNFPIWGNYFWMQYIVVILAFIGLKIQCGILKFSLTRLSFESNVSDINQNNSTRK
jgi:hypothetical protein